MPIQFSWDPDYLVGHDTLDAQHRDLLARCEALTGAVGEADTGFDDRLKTLLALAEEHFASEQALLGECDFPDLPELQEERQEYAHLLAELVTPEHFNPQELQRFLGLWWVGHIVGSSASIRTWLAARNP